jgi:hypothetical protein
LEVKGDHNQRMDKAKKLASQELLVIGRSPALGRYRLETVDGESLLLGRCKGNEIMLDMETQRDGVWVPDGQIPGWSHTLPYPRPEGKKSGTCFVRSCKGDITLNPDASGHEWAGLPDDAVRTE